MLKWFLSPDGEKLLVIDVIEKGLLSEFFPLPYLIECAKQRIWNGKPSTTQLINGTRLEYLKILTPYSEDPDRQSFRILGTRGHNQLELNTPKELLAECGLIEDEITGVFDLLEQIAGEYVLTDYKVWGSFKVGKALGLEKKKRPMFDNDGVPVLYQKKGKWGLSGTQKQEDYYEPNQKKIDIPDVELQLNRYRNILEKVLDIEIPRMRVFAPIRDGNTRSAKSQGLKTNTKMIYIRELDRDFVRDYFITKKNALLDSLNGFQDDIGEGFDLLEKVKEGPDILDYSEPYFFNILKENAPPMCSNIENWDGRRCEGYCSVSEMCSMIESNKESAPTINPKYEKKAPKPVIKVIERFKYIETE